MAGTPRITIIGAGPTGNLLAIFLARRGHHPLVVERRPLAALHDEGGGRSINLALAARGVAALERVDLRAEIEPLLLPLTGRMIHEEDGSQRFSPYGQTAAECIYSVSRFKLNLALQRVAHERYGVEYRFGAECRDIDPDSLAPVVYDHTGSSTLESDVTFAADGAGSAVRRALLERGAVMATEALLDHGYKELGVAAGAAGEFVFDSGALHIWPRDDFMLIALPNTDHSFTATLFLPLEGRVSFRALETRGGVTELFATRFADALPAIPDLERQFATNPTGELGTVRCAPWAHAGRLLLLGDAAHAIVPFHGQGMNAAFEDVVELDRSIAAHGADWRRVLAAFAEARVDDANAIADMALDNYLEMRALVRDPQFRLRREVELELERRFPAHFIPRYAMVMFHPEIAYAEAQRRGAAQRALLERLTRDARTLADVDFELAERLLAGVPP